MRSTIMELLNIKALKAAKAIPVDGMDFCRGEREDVDVLNETSIFEVNK